VVLQVFADARQVVYHRDVEAFQQGARANPGTLQQLRRSNGAGAYDHFLAGAGFDALFAVADQVSHANGALAVEQYAVSQGVSDDGQVRALLGLVQVATGGARTAALLGYGAVHRTEAFLLVAVEVFGARVAGLHAGFDHGVEQRVVTGLWRGHADRAFAAVIVVRADVAGFGFAEVREAVEVGPVFQAWQFRPAVEVHGVATDVAHAVDQRRATQALATATFHAAAVHVRLRVGLVGPVVAAALQREGQGGGHLGAEVEAVVGATGFQQQYGDAGVLGQASRQGVTGGACSDDDVIEFLGHESTLVLAVIRERKRPCGGNGRGGTGP